MNLPNKISLTRIFMIPVFVLVFFLDDFMKVGNVSLAYAISGAIFAIAACTDFIDGYIARKYKLVTNLGKFLDPIADKVLVSTAMILLLAMKEALLRGWSYTEPIYIALAVSICVIMARELIISAFRQIAAARGLVLAAEKLGKYKTTFQDIAITVLLVSASIPNLAGDIVCYVGLGLFVIATVLTVWSGITYVVKNRQVLKDA